MNTTQQQQKSVCPSRHRTVTSDTQTPRSEDGQRGGHVRRAWAGVALERSAESISAAIAARMTDGNAQGPHPAPATVTCPDDLKPNTTMGGPNALSQHPRLYHRDSQVMLNFLPRPQHLGVHPHINK